MSDESDRPKKKKKKKVVEERSGWEKFKYSPIRFAILFALVVVAAVMAYLLYEKMQREKNAQLMWPVPQMT